MRGLAVEIDSVGRAVFNTLRTGDVVYSQVGHGSVEFDHPGMTSFFITPFGKERTTTPPTSTSSGTATRTILL